MANRRMIDKNFILSDSFTALAVRSQVLYIRLIVSADDEGFVSNIKMLGGSKKSLDELTNVGLIYRFDTGCVLITHWFVHNSIRKDRSTPTQYIREKALVMLDEDHIYRFAECQPTDNQMTTQDKINKDNINKININKDNIEEVKKEQTTGKTDAFYDDFALRKQNALRRLAEWNPT